MIKYCENCGKPVPFDDRNAQRGKYCGRECAKEAHNRQKQESKRRGQVRTPWGLYLSKEDANMLAVWLDTEQDFIDHPDPADDYWLDDNLVGCTERSDWLDGHRLADVDENELFDRLDRLTEAQARRLHRAALKRAAAA